MASFSAGTTFTDGVANDVTAAKLGALVNNATPTSGLIQDRTTETIVGSNDTLLLGDASDSNNLKKMTVANVFKSELTGTINSTSGTITTATIPTLVATTLVTTGTGTAASPAIVPTGDTNTGIFFPAADTIAFSEGGTESVRIDSSGNVGIGTTSPAGKFDVVGGRSFFSAASEQYGIGVKYVSTGGPVYFGAASSSATPDAVISGAGGGALMTLQNGGNVGIGTTSPTDAKLSVHANNLTIPAIAARYSAAGYKMGFGVYNVLGYPYLGLNCNQVTSSNNQTYDLSAHATKLDMSIDGSTPGFVFSTAASGTAGSAITWSERLRIDSSGNVGVGTNSPSTPSGKCLTIYDSSIARLNLKNSASGDTSNDGVELYINSSDAYLNNRENGTVGIGTNNTTRLLIDSSGNVGIGASSPSFNTGSGLEVLRAGVSTVRLYNTSSTTVGEIRADSVGLTLDGIGATSILRLSTGGGERLRIDSSGFVSIGTATALSALHVHGNVTLSNTTTATSAGTGGLSKPATYAGYLTVSINGTSRKIPYYAT